jgi:hypothetical protein
VQRSVNRERVHHQKVERPLQFVRCASHDPLT